jgi:hypothetical protein
MDWDDGDDKNYRGKKDRIFVSMTESYEVRYFVDQYLKTRNYKVASDGRRIVLGQLEKYPGNAPWKRDDLNRFLDAAFQKK